MVQPGRSGPATAPKAAGKVPAGLFNSRNELAVTSIFGWCLSSISKDDVVHNIQNYLQGFDGGQAQVYRCRWQNLPAQWDGSQSVIEDGTPVAVKIMKLVKPGMKPFEQMTAQHEFLSAGRYLERQLRIEVNILGALHHPYPEGSCGKRVVHPLGIIRWGGEWQEDPVKRAQLYWEPMYGFCLPYYELGSLMALMRTVCHDRADPGVTSRLLSYRNISSELLTLARELRKIHTIACGGKGLVLQDLTANNLLCEDDPKSGGVRLLFSDPALALPAEFIERSPHVNSTGTWLWGSSKARNQRFDPTADLYSLCYCFADLWMVAEGAPVLPSDMVAIMDMDTSREQAVQFMRTMMTECLQLERYGSRIVRRTQRHTPVAWLGAWTILLGFRDYKDIKHWRDQGLPCLRPTEEQMLLVFESWARVVELAEDLPADLTTEQACSPACAELVGSMTQLLATLVSLSHLDDAGPQQDANLAWLAANFMALDHPLVAAMRAQGAAGVGAPDPKTAVYDVGSAGWPDIFMGARTAVIKGHDLHTLRAGAAEQCNRMDEDQAHALAKWLAEQGVSLPARLQLAFFKAGVPLGTGVAAAAGAFGTARACAVAPAANRSFHIAAQNGLAATDDTSEPVPSPTKRRMIAAGTAVPGGCPPAACFSAGSSPCPTAAAAGAASVPPAPPPVRQLAWLAAEQPASLVWQRQANQFAAGARPPPASAVPGGAPSRQFGTPAVPAAAVCGAPGPIRAAPMDSPSIAHAAEPADGSSSTSSAFGPAPLPDSHPAASDAADSWGPGPALAASAPGPTHVPGPSSPLKRKACPAPPEPAQAAVQWLPDVLRAKQEGRPRQDLDWQNARIQALLSDPDAAHLAAPAWYSDEAELAGPVEPAVMGQLTSPPRCVPRPR